MLRLTQYSTQSSPGTIYLYNDIIAKIRLMRSVKVTKLVIKTCFKQHKF